MIIYKIGYHNLSLKKGLKFKSGSFKSFQAYDVIQVVFTASRTPNNGIINTFKVGYTNWTVQEGAKGQI